MASTSFFSSSGTSSTLQTTFTASVEAAQAAQVAAEAAQALAQQAKTDAESANSTATNQATISSDHRLDAGKYAVNAANSSFTLTSTNGGTSGLYSALHYQTLAAASQSAASTSEGNASGSATASAASAVTAGHYAVKVDAVVPSTSDYSAKAWATNTIVDTSGGGSAKSWATKADSATVDGSEFSAKTYAIGGSLATGSAKNWSLGGGSGFTTSTAVAGGLYSAKYYAEAAQSAASNAQGSLTSFQAVYLGSGSSDPSSGHTSGDIFFNTTVNKLKYFNGSSWIAIEAAVGGASEGFAIAMSAAL